MLCECHVIWYPAAALGIIPMSTYLEWTRINLAVRCQSFLFGPRALSVIHPVRYSFAANFHCHFWNIFSFLSAPPLSAGIVCPLSDISRGFFRLSLPLIPIPRGQKWLVFWELGEPNTFLFWFSVEASAGDKRSRKGLDLEDSHAKRHQDRIFMRFSLHHAAEMSNGGPGACGRETITDDGGTRRRVEIKDPSSLACSFGGIC